MILSRSHLNFVKVFSQSRQDLSTLWSHYWTLSSDKTHYCCGVFCIIFHVLMSSFIWCRKLMRPSTMVKCDEDIHFSSRSAWLMSTWWRTSLKFMFKNRMQRGSQCSQLIVEAVSDDIMSWNNYLIRSFHLLSITFSNKTIIIIIISGQLGK